MINPFTNIQPQTFMKKTILIAMLIAFSFTANSQDSLIKKSTFGVQTGFLGVWVYNETRIAPEIALRTEIGLDAGIWGGKYYKKTGFLLAPVISVEPRWYYNLEKRKNKNRNIQDNAGNFLALKITHHPNWFVISNYKNTKVISDISIIPTWGIKRNIGNHFNYETGIGLGYQYFFAKKAGYTKNESGLGLNLHLKIGYRF